MGQDAHGGVVFQLADEHDAADGGSNVDGAETPLQTLHSSGLVQMPDQQNSAACSLRYLSQPHEDRYLCFLSRCRVHCNLPALFILAA